MPLKSFQRGKRILATTDASQKIVTGKVEEYRSSSYFATKVQDPYITFKYYRYGASMGPTRFYWHDISAGTLTELTVVSSNGSTYNTGFSGQHHTDYGQTWLTGTINLATYETTGYGRFVVRHVTIDSQSYYAGDFQMDHIEIHTAVGDTINLDPDLYRQNTNDKFWQRSTSFDTAWSTTHAWTDVSYGTDASALWNYGAGGTGSGSTGDTVNSDGSGSEYYLYTEVSGAANRYSYLQTKYQYDLFSGVSQ